MKQYLSFTTCWLMRISFVRGGGRYVDDPEVSNTGGIEGKDSKSNVAVSKTSTQRKPGWIVSCLGLRQTRPSVIPPYGKALLSHLSRSQLRSASPICFSTSAASSGVALGRMPGSVKLVLRREMTTNTKSITPTTGMKTVRCSTRKGQLEERGGGATTSLKDPKNPTYSVSRAHVAIDIQ